MNVEASLVINGPESIEAAAKQALRDCVLTAAAAAAGTGLATAGAGAAAAIAAGKVAFSACMASKGVQVVDQYSIDLDTRTNWTEWG